MFCYNEIYYYLNVKNRPGANFISQRFEFGVSFGMSLVGDYHEVGVTPNLELLVIFGMS